MQKATNVIKQIAELTDRAILFHSASGKDSIALLDLMSPHFKEIVCAFMYLVPNLEHNNKYIGWATRKYPNATFVQLPHYALTQYIKLGFMGCKRNPKQKRYTLEQLTQEVRVRTNIEWAFFGFKQSDSLNRRIMLRTYKDQAINEKTKKVYPLSPYKNSDVRNYISQHNLITPEVTDPKHQSAGEDITDINYLLFLKHNYPRDLKTVFEHFPLAEKVLFDYENQNIEQYGTVNT